MASNNAIKIGVREFRAHLADYLRQAREGRSFVVVSRGEAIARLGPPTEPARRRPGTLAGRIIMAPDFDTLPDDLIDAFESGH